MVIILTKIFLPLKRLPFLSHKCALDSPINPKFVKKYTNALFLLITIFHS